MFKRTAISALVLGALCTAPVYAEQTITGPDSVMQASNTYDIPAGALSQALLKLAADSGLSLSAQANLTLGKEADALNGDYTLAQALQQLLAGTRLNAVVQDDVIYLSQPLAAVNSEPFEMDALAVTAQRNDRVSKGATGLALAIKDTPQSISTIDQESMADNGLTASNEALSFITGVNVDQYETNRARYNSRGFGIQLTQVDGLGMTNDWGTVIGQKDTFLFEKIEVIRGANGLLTGVGNASGTINFVRKRPTNIDEGQLNLSAGSYGKMRGAVDYNKVLTEDGRWAARVVAVGEQSDSYIRDLEDQHQSLYAVVDGQIGDNGILTFGMNYRNAEQDAPMWGAMPLNIDGGGQLELDRSSSSSAEWAYYDTKTNDAFVEYSHFLPNDWELKGTYTYREYEGDSKLFFASAPNNSVNADGTGLFSFPYSGFTKLENNVFDLNLSGDFNAFEREHSFLAGVSYSRQDSKRYVRNFDTDTYRGQPLPALPYGGDVPVEPEFGPKTLTGTGEQQLTRFYLASKLELTDALHSIVGVNAIKLEREGDSIFGGGSTTTNYPDTEEVSPYLSVLYDFTDDVVGYVSYSDIYQNQDQVGYDGNYLDPVKGVNYEAGVKAEWLDNRVLTTFSVFTAEQDGLATLGEGRNAEGDRYYVPKEVKSKGVEMEIMGHVTPRTRMSLGLTHLNLEGADGQDIYEYVPRTTVKFMMDTRVEQVPGLKVGVNTRWQSDIESTYGMTQDDYMLTNAFASYELSDDATVRLNIDNIFNEKYIQSLYSTAYYGAPRTASMSFDYHF
ncbi:TonB-dependent siderophore receptor [Marinomonas ostreistagni]|uniref:TonB-dependent siderophore receptor n=1 Tax=Marinomonas ostreistagni TaxID=359209 RepID=UPI00194F4B55|nr:TonB-dependent siderophore receptor [Marinomonas ostreistagni]MBM6550618.1 TonB-dependent siderophore receptor [Marinomonas ostreistagni]